MGVTTKTEAIRYICPNCETDYVLWDDSMPPISAGRSNDLREIVRKQHDEVGTCKFCVRKYPSVPTTAEMDGLLTPEDMRNRFKVMKQCYSCSKWTEHDTREANQPCHNCGGSEFDSAGSKSIRTFRESVDGKRKIKKR